MFIIGNWSGDMHKKPLKIVIEKISYTHFIPC